MARCINAIGLVLILLFGCDAYGQFDSWKRYHSSDKFSVELPSPLVRVRYFDGEHGANWDNQPKWVKSYSSVETNLDEARFGINVMVLPTGYTKRGVSWNELLEYLAVLYIGDDDHAEFDIRREVNLNRLRGTEYYFISGDLGSLFTRGRIFDLGHRKIIMMIFIGKNRADLDSKEADRFFNSFSVSK